MPKALSSTQTKCVMLEADNTSTMIDSATSPLHTRKLAAWTVSQLLSRRLHPSFAFSSFDIEHFEIGSKDLADRNKGDTKDGLHNPVIQMANLNNWEPIDVQKIVDDQEDQDAGRLCKTGGIQGIRQLEWTCALPEVGTAGFGISNFPAPDSSEGFTPGWCTMVSSIQLLYQTFANHLHSTLSSTSATNLASATSTSST
jgi:hypothetical protein